MRNALVGRYYFLMVRREPLTAPARKSRIASALRACIRAPCGIVSVGGAWGVSRLCVVMIRGRAESARISACCIAIQLFEYNHYYGNTGSDSNLILHPTETTAVDPDLFKYVVGVFDSNSLAPNPSSPLIDAGDPSILDLDHLPPPDRRQLQDDLTPRLKSL